MAIRCCDWTSGNDWSGAGGADNGGYTGALAAWASGTTYAAGDRVYYGTAPSRTVWRSLVGSNLGNTPAEGSNWTCIADGVPNGSGVCAKPFRSITDASSGLTGGDEVHCGKSGARAVISVPLSWTYNSTTVTATGDIRAEVAAGNHIGKSTAAIGTNEGVYRVSSVAYSSGSNTTTITLSSRYAGTSGAATSHRVPYHNLGTPAATNTNVQSVSASGTSAPARLLVTGGWDLSTGQRTGETWYNTDPAGTQRGIGLALGSKSWVDVQYLGMMCLTSGFSMGACGGCRILNCSASYCGLASNYCAFGIANGSVACGVEDCYAFGGTSNGSGLLFANYGRNWASRCGAYGLPYGVQGGFTAVTLNTVEASCCTTGFYVSGNTGLMWKLLNCAARSNTTGFSASTAHMVYAYNLVLSGNGTDVTVTGAGRQDLPILFSQKHGGVPGAHKVLWEQGVVARDATNYRTAAPGVSFAPSSASFALWNWDGFGGAGIGGGPALAGTQYTLSIWLRKSASFNGTVYLEAYNSHEALVAGPTAAAGLSSSDWTQYSITIAAGNMPEDGVVRLRLKVAGTAGAVYADDFAVVSP